MNKSSIRSILSTNKKRNHASLYSKARAETLKAIRLRLSRGVSLAVSYGDMVSKLSADKKAILDVMERGTGTIENEVSRLGGDKDAVARTLREYPYARSIPVTVEGVLEDSGDIFVGAQMRVDELYAVSSAANRAITSIQDIFSTLVTESLDGGYTDSIQEEYMESIKTSLKDAFSGTEATVTFEDATLPETLLDALLDEETGSYARRSRDAIARITKSQHFQVPVITLKGMDKLTLYSAPVPTTADGLLDWDGEYNLFTHRVIQDTPSVPATSLTNDYHSSTVVGPDDFVRLSLLESVQRLSALMIGEVLLGIKQICLEEVHEIADRMADAQTAMERAMLSRIHTASAISSTALLNTGSDLRYSLESMTHRPGFASLFADHESAGAPIQSLQMSEAASVSTTLLSLSNALQAISFVNETGHVLPVKGDRFDVWLRRHGYSDLVVSLANSNITNSSRPNSSRVNPDASVVSTTRYNALDTVGKRLLDGAEVLHVTPPLFSLNSMASHVDTALQDYSHSLTGAIHRYQKILLAADAYNTSSSIEGAVNDLVDEVTEVVASSTQIDRRAYTGLIPKKMDGESDLPADIARVVINARDKFKKSFSKLTPTLPDTTKMTLGSSFEILPIESATLDALTINNDTSAINAAATDFSAAVKDYSDTVMDASVRWEEETKGTTAENYITNMVNRIAHNYLLGEIGYLQSTMVDKVDSVIKSSRAIASRMNGFMSVLDRVNDLEQLEYDTEAALHELDELSNLSFDLEFQATDILQSCLGADSESLVMNSLEYETLYPDSEIDWKKMIVTAAKVVWEHILKLARMIMETLEKVRRIVKKHYKNLVSKANAGIDSLKDVMNDVTLSEEDQANIRIKEARIKERKDLTDNPGKAPSVVFKEIILPATQGVVKPPSEEAMSRMDGRSLKVIGSYWENAEKYYDKPEQFYRYTVDVVKKAGENFRDIVSRIEAYQASILRLSTVLRTVMDSNVKDNIEEDGAKDLCILVGKTMKEVDDAVSLERIDRSTVKEPLHSYLKSRDKFVPSRVAMGTWEGDVDFHVQKAFTSWLRKGPHRDITSDIHEAIHSVREYSKDKEFIKTQFVTIFPTVEGFSGAKDNAIRLHGAAQLFDYKKVEKLGKVREKALSGDWSLSDRDNLYLIKAALHDVLVNYLTVYQKNINVLSSIGKDLYATLTGSSLNTLQHTTTVSKDQLEFYTELRKAMKDSVGVGHWENVI